jgi:hypothetical protein
MEAPLQFPLHNATMSESCKEQGRTVCGLVSLHVYSMFRHGANECPAKRPTDDSHLKPEGVGPDIKSLDTYEDEQMPSPFPRDPMFELTDPHHLAPERLRTLQQATTRPHGAYVKSLGPRLSQGPHGLRKACEHVAWRQLRLNSQLSCIPVSLSAPERTSSVLPLDGRS